QEKMAIIKLEDLDGIIEVLVFPAVYQKVSRYIQANLVVMVRGRINLKEEPPKIVVNDLFPVDEFYSLITAIDITLSPGTRENIFDSLKGILTISPGKIPVYLHLDSPSKSRMKIVVGEDLYVTPSEKLVGDIENLLGEDRLSLRI
ncbi:MAG: hypothetical protein KKE64_00690, partial [Candidatus Omnitrophica bacterium]|nr:hypothetical protein [Candidatus Omnitrophota bacterium]